VFPSDCNRRNQVDGNAAGSTPVAAPSPVAVLLSSLKASNRRPPLQTMPALMKFASSE
jgi:hypothetical protein